MHYSSRQRTQRKLNCSRLPQANEGAALSHVTAATAYNKGSNVADSKSCSSSSQNL